MFLVFVGFSFAPAIDIQAELPEDTFEATDVANSKSKSKKLPKSRTSKPARKGGSAKENVRSENASATSANSGTAPSVPKLKCLTNSNGSHTSASKKGSGRASLLGGGGTHRSKSTVKTSSDKASIKSKGTRSDFRKFFCFCFWIVFGQSNKTFIWIDRASG